MSNRNGVLLIGGSGFLGLALARALASLGREVHIVSRHVEPGDRLGLHFHRGGQDGPIVVPALLRRCRDVVHLASTTTPGSSARRPRIDAEENLLPAARLVEFMSDCPPARLIFASSGGAVYGNPPRLPVDESLAPHPLSYHAAGKVALEALFGAFAHANDIPLAVLRPSNLYGPGQSLRGGFGLVRTLLDKALRGAQVEIWGDGAAVRDYLYIDDAVAACLSLSDNVDAIGPFNAGSGVGTSIVDLITLVVKVTGVDLEVTKRTARGTDVRAIVLDSSRLSAATGWVPRVGLEQGLQETWSCLKKTST